MSKHKGEHRRMSTTDVYLLIRIANITMEETAQYLQQLVTTTGGRRGVSVAVYLYKAAQAGKSRSNLSVIRTGKYKGGFFK